MGVSPPADDGALGVIVVGIVVRRDVDGQTLRFVPEVFLFQRVRIVLGVAGDENLTAFLVHGGVDPGIRGGSQNFQAGNGFNVGTLHGGVPGVRNPEFVVEAPEQNGALVVRVMGVHAEQLFREGFFLNAVVVVKSRLRAPADVEGGMDVGFAPLHDLAQFRPVVHIFKGHLLHRRAGDHHAVEFPILQFVEGFIEIQQMLLRGIFGAVGGDHHQLQMHLQGRIAEQTAELGLRDDFRWHEIQQHDFQRADVLGLCPGLSHNENVFLLQNARCRQVVGNLNGHTLSS